MKLDDDIFKVECPACGELKERTAFRLLSRGQRSTFCDGCSTAAREKWFAQNSVEVSERVAAFRAGKKTG
jgi:Zn ribbon nucleic-acid-binding protein